MRREVGHQIIQQFWLACQALPHQLDKILRGLLACLGFYQLSIEAAKEVIFELLTKFQVRLRVLECLTLFIRDGDGRLLPVLRRWVEADVSCQSHEVASPSQRGIHTSRLSMFYFSRNGQHAMLASAALR